MKHRYAPIAALAVSLLAGCATSPNRAVAWDYKTVEGKVFGNEKRLDAAINNQVADGWEFVSASHFGNDIG